MNKQYNTVDDKRLPRNICATQDYLLELKVYSCSYLCAAPVINEISAVIVFRKQVTGV